MACLLATQDVILLLNDTHSRITFPSPTRLPSDFLAYRPPQAARTITTERIFGNENTFATVLLPVKSLLSMLQLPLLLANACFPYTHNASGLSENSGVPYTLVTDPAYFS